MNSNILEFFIKMKDLSGPAVLKTVENVRKIEKTANDANRRLDETNKRMRDLRGADPSGSGAYGVAKIRNEVVKLNDELKKTTGDSSSGGVSGYLGKLARGFALGTALFGALSFGKSAAQSGINFEKTNKSFEVLTGNKGIGQSLAGDLNKLQQDTILGPEVFKSAQTMLGFGISADKIMPTMKMLGDISMGDADKLDRLTLAFSQTQAAGRLMGQDLLQFINAGFNPLQEISKNTGISMADLKKKMEDGAISAKMVEDAFRSATGTGGLFNNMMNQMGETTGGKIAQLQGNVESLKIAIGQRMQPAINWFVGGLSRIVTNVRSWFEIPIEKKLGDQIVKIQALQAELTSSNTTHERQIELLRELEQINPNIVKGINEQNISYSKLAENINSVTGALQSKIFMENFDKKNAGVLTEFGSAEMSRKKNLADIMNAVASADPSLAARTDLTLGQKQMMAANILKSRLAADPRGGIRDKTNLRGDWVGNEYTDDYKNLAAIRAGIRNYNQAGKTIETLYPKIKEINATKDVLAAQIESALGIKTMTAADIKGDGKDGGGGFSGGGGSTGGGSGIASGITGGGPRVVTINGVKFADKIEINSNGMDDGMKQLEDKLEQMMLRVLNSGASVQ